MSSIKCRYTGSTNSASNIHQRFRRGSVGHFDRPGGGAELTCDYFMEVPRRNFRETMTVLEQNVPMSELDQRVYA